MKKVSKLLILKEWVTKLLKKINRTAVMTGLVNCATIAKRGHLLPQQIPNHNLFSTLQKVAKLPRLKGWNMHKERSSSTNNQHWRVLKINPIIIASRSFMLWCNKIHFKTILILSKIARKLTKRLEMQRTKMEEICNHKYIPNPSKSQNTLVQSLERKFH